MYRELTSYKKVDGAVARISRGRGEAGQTQKKRMVQNVTFSRPEKCINMAPFFLNFYCSTLFLSPTFFSY